MSAEPDLRSTDKSSCAAARALLAPSHTGVVDKSDNLRLRGSQHSDPIALIVARYDASERRWVSAPEAETLLREAGARVIYYSADGTIDGPLISLVDGLALFAAADIVVCAHGAAEVNMYVMRPGSTMIEIAPQVRMICVWCTFVVACVSQYHVCASVLLNAALFMHVVH